MRKRVLVQLTIAVLLPSLGAFLLAWVAFCQFENAMEKVAASYVQNLARGAAARLESSGWDLRIDGSWRPSQFRSLIVGLADLMEDDILIPGTFAVFDGRGNLLYATSDVDMLTAIWNKSFPVMGARTTKDDKGKTYSVAVYPVLERDIFVVAAVSWERFLGSIVPMTVIWPFLIGLLGLTGILAVYVMWQKVILPLKDLEEEVSGLKWGEDEPEEKAPDAADELQRLRDSFVLLAKSAIERVNLSKHYVNDLVRVQEEERARISREIHDGPLQDVTALIQRLRLLASDIDSPDKRRDSLKEAEKVAMFGVREMRQLCDNLTPPWLDLGISHALTELSERLSRQLNVKIYLDAEEVKDLPDDAVMALFRVTQEAVNNSVRHGGAGKVRVILKKTDDKVLLDIEDDGKGFEVPCNVEELRIQGHRGLSNMKERLSIVGGTIKINSSEGGGTVIHCELPLPVVE